MDRTKFHGVVRKTLYGTFFPEQKTVDGYEAVLYANEIRYRLPKIQLAYVLATAYHETGHTMTPQAERGRGRGKPYGVEVQGNVYYGRGLVPLRGYENYVKMGKILGVDLEKNPDLALQSPIAVDILFTGMVEGVFTGEKLADYFADSLKPVLARAVLGGKSQASLIAGYYGHFLDALVSASAAPANRTADVVKEVQVLLREIGEKLGNLIKE